MAPAAVLGAVTLFVVAFFRNPARELPGDENSVVAPADGRVLAVDAIEDERGRKGLRIAIFLSVFDVHVNRAPLAGRVVSLDARRHALPRRLGPARRTRERAARDGAGARRRAPHRRHADHRPDRAAHRLPREGRRVAPARRALRTDPLRLAHRRAAAAGQRRDGEGGRSRARRRVDPRRGSERRNERPPLRAPRVAPATPSPPASQRAASPPSRRLSAAAALHHREPVLRLLHDREGAGRATSSSPRSASSSPASATGSTAASRGSRRRPRSSASSTTRSPTSSRSAWRRRSSPSTAVTSRASGAPASRSRSCSWRVPRCGSRASTCSRRATAVASRDCRARRPRAWSSATRALRLVPARRADRRGGSRSRSWRQGVAALGLLMVSAIPYRSFKEIDLRHSYRAIVVMVLALALVVQEPQISLFVIGAALRALGTRRVGLARDLRPSAREAAAALPCPRRRRRRRHERDRPHLRHHAARRRAVARLQHEPRREAHAGAPARAARRRRDRSRLPDRERRRLRGGARDRRAKCAGSRSAVSRAPAQADVERAGQALEGAARPRIHIFIATSDIHLEHKLRMSRERVLEEVDRAVRQARRYCDDVEFSAEDATRSDWEYLVQVFDVALRAGAPHAERARHRRLHHAGRDRGALPPPARARPGRRRRRSSRRTATTTSASRSPTGWPRCAPAPARSSAP